MLVFFKNNFLLKTKEICVYLVLFSPKGCSDWDLGEDLGFGFFFNYRLRNILGSSQFSVGLADFIGLVFA